MNNPNAAENLVPFTPGYDPRRNTTGKNKGVKRWDTVIQELLGDETLADKMLAKKPGWWNDLANRNLAYLIAAAMALQAVNGNTKAAEWLRKAGFGDKLELDGTNLVERVVEVYDMTPIKHEDREQAETGT